MCIDQSLGVLLVGSLDYKLKCKKLDAGLTTSSSTTKGLGNTVNELPDRREGTDTEALYPGVTGEDGLNSIEADDDDDEGSQYINLNSLISKVKFKNKSICEFVSVSMDNKIEFWDLQKSKLTPVGSVMLNRRRHVNDATESRIGEESTGAGCIDEGEWEHVEEDDCLTVVDWSSDDKFVVCGGLSGQLYVLNMATEETSTSANMSLQAVTTFNGISTNFTSSQKPVVQISSQ
ncbi:unnamed protein product [Ambrosiozyma monospora]|uniref:Unnamed protein product n=1 Tax=Ambrosiozyma monospora TaxID=43982 RepID=A0ACB5TBP9_AMBMO|nr:unnamed protein product [Ambrosiozyma monospora]